MMGPGEEAAAGVALPLPLPPLLLLLLVVIVVVTVVVLLVLVRAGRRRGPAGRVPPDVSVPPAAGMCSAVNGDGDPVVTTTSYEEWSATDDDEEHIRTMATADLMEFYANEIVEELAHRPYIELGIHSDSDSELAAAYSGLETIMEETSDDMRSDTDSMRSGPTSWAWSQDSADVETVIDAGRGRDSRFEDDFNPLDGVEAAMAASGKLANGIARTGRSSDKYGQLFDFEAFLKHDASGAGGVSEPPSMDPMFVTSATQFPFSDCEQAAPHAVPLPLPPGGTDGTGFRLGPLDGCCQWSPFTSLPERGDDGPRELAFSLDDVLGHRTRPGEPGNGRPPEPVTSGEVLGATCNGSSGVTAAAPPAAGAALSGGRSVAAHRGGEGGSGVPKWDLGSCEDFENLNRRIESLTFDFEEEERRSLEFIVDGDGDGDGDAGSSEESGESGESSESGGAASACSARRQRDWRVRRFHSFGDLSMITEDELQEGGGQRRLEARDATERPARRRPAGHPGLLRHSSENLSEDSGYGDHTGDRVSPPNPRATSLLPSSAPAGTGVGALTLSPRHSAIRRLTKSTSDLSPGSQRRRRLLELISRDEQRRARLYSDSRDAALSPDARLLPPRLSDAPPPVDSDGGEETERGTPTGDDGHDRDARNARDAGEGTEERDEIESVLVLLENEESNSVIQVLREKVARARALDSMASAAAAAPVPAPRSAVQRAPAVYQNVPTGARGRRSAASSAAAAPTRRSSETETPPPNRDRRVKRDIEQFERIKEAFLEKGTYNVHADIAPAPTRADSGSTPELSDRRRGEGARPDHGGDTRPADSARSAAHAAGGGTTVHAAVNKGSPETQHDPGGIQGHRTSDNTTRAEPERTAEQPRDIYLSDSEAQLVRMSRSAFGRPKPLDLKLAEEFLLLEGIEGEGEGEVYPVDAEEYPRGRESPCGGVEWGPAACVPPLREEVAARDGQPISGAGETGPPGWTEGGVPGPGRSRSLWNLAAAVNAAPPPQPECADGTCDWQRSRNRHGAWLLSKSVQDLWSENNMDSPRRLDYYNQTMEWPGSGDYLAACSAERLRGGALSPASSSGLPTDAYCETPPAPHPHRTPLNLDGGGAGAATCGAAALKLGRPPSDVCSSWLAASMEPDTSEHRSLNGQAYLVEPQAARPAGTAPLTDGSDARTMRAHNSFTARVPVRAYGAGSDVEVYINREQPVAEERQEQRPEQTGQARVRRGVQFSPVVSEVQWRESYLESEPDTRQDTRQDSRTNGQQHQQQQQQQQQRLPQSADTNGASHQTQPVQSGAERAAQRHRSPPPAPPPRQTPQRAAPEPPQRASESAEQRDGQRDGLPTTEAGAAGGAAAGLRAVRPPTVPVVAPRSSASLPSPATAPAVGAGGQTEGPVKSNTIGPIRGRSNGGQASPVTVRTQQIRPEKIEKPEKPPKTSVLQRLGLGRLSGRSKPKPPPKPENMRPTRSPPPPPASPPPPSVSVSQPPAVSPVVSGQAEGHRPVTSTPVVGQRPAGSAVPAPVASPVVAAERSASPASPVSPVVGGQTKGNVSPSVTSGSDQSTAEQSQSSSNQSATQSVRVGVGSVDQSAAKSDFHAPPSPAVRTKSLSLPRTGAEIQLESGSPAVSGVGAAASSAGASAADTPSGAGRPTAKPPLPPQALRAQTQAARARLTSARRHFFQLEQQRVIPLRSVPAAPIPDAAPSQTGSNGRPSAAAHINDAFERFRRRAQEDRARLAKSTPDLSLIEAATRSIVRPLVPPPPPSSAAAVPSSIDRRAAAAGDSRSVTLQQEGNVVILHADGGAAAARPASKSRDRFAQRRAAALARARSRSVGVLETDLDAPCAPHQETDLDAIVLSLQQCIDEATPPREKAKSLLHLDRGGMEFSLPRAAAADSRAKSMEFLLDDDNKTAVQPPENDLMRGDRQLSEHELRFQRSLRNLNTPEWYKKSSVKPEAGLRRDYGSGSLAGGWSGLNSKSTSKESLQSSRCTTPTTQSKVVIPSRVRAPDWRYVRGTSRESLASPGSGAASPSVSERPGSGAQSPVSSLGGVHSRRPVYMGWRSQERLSTSGYQTPVDRLANSFTRNRSEGNLTGSGGGRLSLPRGSSGASSATGSTSSVSGALRPPPDLDVHTSIREVTSAIVHYFDSAGGPGSAGESGGRGGASPRSPRRRRSPAGARSSRSTSPSKRPVWLETAFVGTKPMDEPPTPEAAGAVLSDPLAAGGGSGGSGATSPTPPPVSESRADPPAADRYEFGSVRPAPAPPVGTRRRGSSVTVEDVLDSLLALPPTKQQQLKQQQQREQQREQQQLQQQREREQREQQQQREQWDLQQSAPQPRRPSSSSSRGSRRGASPSRVLYETSLVGTRYYERPPSVTDDYPSRNGHIVSAGGGGGWNSTTQQPQPGSPPEHRPNAITTVAWVSSEPEPDPDPEPERDPDPVRNTDQDHDPDRDHYPERDHEPDRDPVGDPPLWEELHSVDSASGDHRQHSGSTDNCASSGDSLQAQVSSPTADRRLSDSIDGHKVRFDVSDDEWHPSGEVSGDRGVSLEELGRRLPLADDGSDGDTDRSAATTTPVESSERAGGETRAAETSEDGLTEPADSFITIKCKNSMCLRTTNLTEAKTVFKMCHNCETFYCSRECRRAHWERHRRVCAAIRAQSMSKHIILKIKEDEQLLLEFSRTARQGFLTHGRGLLKVFFPSPESADDFLNRENGTASEALYIKWQDLLPREMGHLVYRDIIDLCKTYNPETRLVLYIVICVFNELPLSGVAKWERQIIPRCAKLKLSPLLGGRSPQRKPSPKITRELDELETLILISLPHSLPHLAAERAREVNFLNIVRHLRSRGVSLRRDYPEVYNRLCAYSEKSVPFSPTTIYPKDTGTGNTFMCLIMPDATPEQLLKIPRDCGKVKTINISQDRAE